MRIAFVVVLLASCVVSPPAGDAGASSESGTESVCAAAGGACVAPGAGCIAQMSLLGCGTTGAICCSVTAGSGTGTSGTGDASLCNTTCEMTCEGDPTCIQNCGC